MVRKIAKLLQNRDFILSLALVIGLLLPQASRWTQHLTLPALALVMSMSTMGLSRGAFSSPRSLIIPALFGILMSYVILGGFILGVSALFIHDNELWKGFIVLAIMPPAVAVIPFTDLLKGNNAFSLAGTVGGYLGALVIMPLVLYNFLESSQFALQRLSIAAIVLIVIPLIVSRILRWRKSDKDLENVKGTITNWSFFVVVYSIVGLNQDVFTNQPLRLLPVAVIAVGSMFVLGLVIEWIGKLFRIDPQTTTSLVLLGTIKNYGLAAGIALSLFSKESALPATVSTIFMFIYIIWIGFKQRLSGGETRQSIPHH
jgi:BASS family bile acid:Na+ symporter